MRRGRIITGMTLLVAAISFSGAPAASAATPQDICTDLKDGVVNGSYTPAEWTAYFKDPTIQGYGCGGVIVPPTTTPVTTTTGVTTTTSTTTTSTAVPLVPTTPVAGGGNQGTQTTIVTPKGTATHGVRGTSHTVQTPTRQAAAAPIATTRAAGTLPFTGAQLALFALVGLALVASGLLLRSTSRPAQRR